MQLSLDHIASPVGDILIVSDGDNLRALDFHDYAPRMHRLLRLHYGGYELTPGTAPRPLRHALEAYFDGELSDLASIAVTTGGTAFQRLIWSELRQIPPGTVTTYGSLAARIGRPTASRAVGMANGANPLNIVVPCHRVVGADSKLTGYGGGLHRKEWLLAHERRHSEG
ncbi:methylated-DNA--[protein]-cysteine S-methyltransferase [Acidisphaera sp. L21]|uniref:methylated-DNA--[protein]-cysteine S-methyltransferase n=1 Tax=Acidisphaera sp. L21 TaxID=1641851 RepID=UPI00131E0A32|nr:methylated-DNA--[protein]-cysteine S-methyltransferase [Acidisphaera sp. L21]